MTRRVEVEHGQWWKEPLMRLILSMRSLTGEQRRSILLYVADCLKKSNRRELAKERGRVRRIVRTHRRSWKLNHPAQVLFHDGYHKACDDILAALSASKGTRG